MNPIASLAYFNPSIRANHLHQFPNKSPSLPRKRGEDPLKPQTRIRQQPSKFRPSDKRESQETGSNVNISANGTVAIARVASVHLEIPRLVAEESRFIEDGRIVGSAIRGEKWDEKRIPRRKSRRFAQTARNKSIVKQTGSTVIKCRPIFPTASIGISIEFSPWIFHAAGLENFWNFFLKKMKFKEFVQRIVFYVFFFFFLTL